MPEESTIEAPAGEMSHDSNPSKPTGIEALMNQLDGAAAAGKDISSEPKPADPAKPATPKPEEAKPATPKPATPPAAAKPETKPEAKPQEVDWSKAPPKWSKIYEEHKSKTNETIRSLEGKIKSLETKPFEQPGDAKKLEAYEKQLAELRAEATDYKTKLVQRDYTQSDEYRRDYVEPAKRIYGDAIAFVTRLKVTDGETERAATQADFDYIRTMPIDVRNKAAKALFGADNAGDVLDFVKDIDRLRRSADIAAERHAQTHERTALEREGKTKQEKQQHDDYYKASIEGASKHERWGKWLTDDENDPEGTKVFRDGLAKIQEITANMDKLPLDQRAAYSAFHHVLAAAAPRLELANSRLTAENEALKEELEKLRGTDPGAEGKQGVAPASEAAARPVGIEGAVAVFDQAPR
jgi:hypothetical protein